MNIKKDISLEDLERSKYISFKKGHQRSETVWISSFKDQEIKILYEAGAQLLSSGCRRDFNTLITDMYLKPARGWLRIKHTEAHRLRELLEGSDEKIASGVVEPRLQIIRIKIKEIIIKYLKS